MRQAGLPNPRTKEVRESTLTLAQAAYGTYFVPAHHTRN